MHLTQAHLFILDSKSMTFLKKYSDAILSLTIGFLLTFILGFLISDERENEFSLNPPADNQNFYVLGNSMFGTGFDLDTFREAFPEKKTEFGYYNGYYSSMWHLAVNVAMNEKSAPKTIIWGFRPTYALMPAFRQNTETDEQVLARKAPEIHKNILARSGDPIYAELDAFAPNPSVLNEVKLDEAKTVEPFELLGSKLIKLIILPFNALNGEQDLRETMINRVSRLLSYKGALDENSKAIKPSDLLIQYVSNGQITTMDALVVDNGERFIKGNEMAFSESFIPPTLRAIEELGSKQIVIIFRPVSTFQEPLPKNTLQFYEDARTHLENNNIPYIDLMTTQSLTKSMYASGDHFTEEGRQLITKLIIDKAKVDNTNESQPIIGDNNYKINALLDDKREQCLQSAYVALAGAEFEILIDQKTDTQHKFVVQMPDKISSDTVRCTFKKDNLDQIILNRSRMLPSTHPRDPLPLDVFVPITELTHRPFTSTTKDNAIIKYFAKFDFIAPSENKYCVVLRHKSPNEGTNSIKIGTNRSNLIDVNLPVTGQKVEDYAITSIPLRLMAREKATLWMTHRENTFTYGVSIEECS